MHPAVKVLLGLIFIGIGLFLFVDAVYPILGLSNYIPGDFLTNFIIVITGMIPPFLIVVGLFVVWLEMDEIKAEREIKAEEDKAKKAAESKSSKAKK